MTTIRPENDLNPIDPQALMYVLLVCLTTTAVLPADRLRNLIDLLNLALQLYGRR